MKNKLEKVEIKQQNIFGNFSIGLIKSSIGA
jgi:hypothetical protein